MSGATHNYRFGQKNNWRRRIWNWVLSKPGKAKRDMGFLVLLGPDAADVEVLLSKGVQSAQIWGIDSHRLNCERTKRAYPGVRVINADVAEVLSAWPSGHPLDGIALDLCCNVSLTSDRVIGSLLSSDAIGGPKDSCAVVVNLLRGRESGAYREHVLDANRTRSALSPDPVRDRFVRHRIIPAFVSAAAAASLPMSFHEMDGLRYTVIGDVCLGSEAFPSYRSGHQTMDSYAAQAFRATKGFLKPEKKRTKMTGTIIAHIATATRLKAGT